MNFLSVTGSRITELEDRSYTGFGIDLAPLSEKGRRQAQKLEQKLCFLQPKSYLLQSQEL